MDFDYSEGDKFQVSEDTSLGSYSLRTDINWGGGSANDGAIFYNNDLIGVVYDNTNVVLSMDLTFV